MGYLYSIVPIIQIITAIHAIKTGRSWYWLWIILFFPLAGSAIYFFVEIMPEYSSGGVGTSLLDAVQPNRELKRLQDNLELADTIENRKALAEYYLRVNQPDRAIELYKGSLRGVFQKDPEVRLDLSSALVAAQRYDEAKATLEELRNSHPAVDPAKRELLYARTLAQLGQESDAISVYERVIDNYGGGEEARCRLAQLVEKAGDKERAKAAYEDILKRSKRFAPHYRRAQREWINLAQDGVKRLSLNEGKGK
jgi:hypothetical protein